LKDHTPDKSILFVDDTSEIIEKKVKTTNNTTLTKCGCLDDLIKILSIKIEFNSS